MGRVNRGMYYNLYSTRNQESYLDTGRGWYFWICKKSPYAVGSVNIECVMQTGGKGEMNGKI